MSEEKHQIDKQYMDLYSNYYSSSGTDPTLIKRSISACQTADGIAESIGAWKPERLLDVGAGDGNVMVQLNARETAKELFAVEISPSGVESIKSKKLSRLREAQLFDGYRIPYPDKYFDLAIAAHVLEHVEHERMFLREVSRVSRRAYIEVPLEHGIRIQRSIDAGKRFGHINFYTKPTFLNVLGTAGMRVISSRVVASSLQYEQHLSGRRKGWIKNFLRESALSASPTLAPWFLVYNAFAYCECS